MAEFTPERLEQEVLRFRMTPEQARERLLEVRAIIDGLLTTHSDVQRIRLYDRFMKRLCRGWSSPDSLMYWSKIASFSDEDIEKQRRLQQGLACPSSDKDTTLP